MTLKAPKTAGNRKLSDKAYNASRGTSKQQGYDSVWARAAKSHRKKEPICRQCLVQHRVTPGDCVDHIVPFRGPDDPLRLDPTNWQTLCVRCHEYKTMRERNGYVADWEPRDGWYVLSGKECSGKSWLMTQLSNAACMVMTWDMDEVSRARGYVRMVGDYHHTEAQLAKLQKDRSDWIERVELKQPDIAILIASNMITAFVFAKRLQAHLVHCWTDEDERQRRIADRHPNPPTPPHPPTGGADTV